ncbi:hypothetical protein GCM10025868_45470 [Angustibacter aerolatus]|uniref:Uncharacterized protein n=1 Tax=Angustibacter aerolatus TaxID=1162965 RepID=A0ABQ6JR42_9ACTN|nr:hypothetical protein GCM10025868_45470 [Angustibacter aerolatus]
MDGAGAVVTADVAGERRDFADPDVESAYARALLALLALRQAARPA